MKLFIRGKMFCWLFNHIMRLMFTNLLYILQKFNNITRFLKRVWPFLDNRCYMVNIRVQHRSFSLKLRIFSARVMKFSIKAFFSKYDQTAENCGFGHIYWRNLLWWVSLFVQWLIYIFISNLNFSLVLLSTIKIIFLQDYVLLIYD